MVPTPMAIERTSRRVRRPTPVARRWQRRVVMRLAVVVVITIAACSEEGAHLTLHAPAGVEATSFRVVLATPDVVPVIAGQRVAPTDLATEAVTYYLQRTDAGAMVESGSLGHADGFALLVEPSTAIDDKAFIPFVILYDESEHIVAIGTFHASDQSPDPSPILVPRGQVVKYTIDVEAVTDVADRDAIAAGDALQVSCMRDDQSTWQSGIAWRPLVGGERRILLPEDPGSSDATQRALDLDCDGAVVAPDTSSADCDDTHARFHAGAQELCDGEDTNCDAAPYLVEPCTATGLCTNPTVSTGVQICDDTTGTLEPGCSSDVQCLCAAGAAPGCAKCLLAYEHGSNGNTSDPCEPQIATIPLSNCESGCTVDVAGTRGGWQAFVAATSQGPFGPVVANVHTGFTLKVKGPSQVTGVANASVGAVDLVVAPTTGPPALLSYDLELAPQSSTCSGGGPFVMSCSGQ
jgi:hypothetical protein